MLSLAIPTCISTVWQHTWMYTASLPLYLKSHHVLLQPLCPGPRGGLRLALKSHIMRRRVTPLLLARPAEVLLLPMAPSPVPAGRQPGTWIRKQAGRKLLAGNQFPAHHSCSRRSWGHLAWVSGPSRQELGSSAMRLSLTMGRRERLWGSPGPASPPTGHLPAVSWVCNSCRRRHRAYVCFWCWIWSDLCCNHQQNDAPSTLAQVRNGRDWAPASCYSRFTKSLSPLGRTALSCLSLTFPLRSAKEHFHGSLTGMFHIQQNCCMEECSQDRAKRSWCVWKGTWDSVWEVKLQMRAGRRATKPKEYY